MEYLFIGGVADGRRVQIPENLQDVFVHIPENFQDVVVAVPEKVKSISDGDDLPVSQCETGKERYVRERFYFENGGVEVFAPVGFSHLDTMKFLVKGYKERS